MVQCPRIVKRHRRCASHWGRHLHTSSQSRPRPRRRTPLSSWKSGRFYGRWWYSFAPKLKKKCLWWFKSFKTPLGRLRVRWSPLPFNIWWHCTVPPPPLAGDVTVVKKPSFLTFCGKILFQKRHVTMRLTPLSPMSHLVIPSRIPHLKCYAFFNGPQTEKSEMS